MAMAGYRSVQLKNGYSEEMEITSLLVHIDVRNPKVCYVLVTVACMSVVFIHRRIIAECSGCFQRCLFLSLSVCLFVCLSAR